MIRLAAETTSLCTVVLDIEPDNVASVRLAQRLGAERRRPERARPTAAAWSALWPCSSCPCRDLDEISTPGSAFLAGR